MPKLKVFKFTWKSFKLSPKSEYAKVQRSCKKVIIVKCIGEHFIGVVKGYERKKTRTLNSFHKSQTQTYL